ncbi:hypothetical protein BTS2_2850 [Bacillus sp. TS-2]|nr:hypothetical protein BTS2_2850 [Bacillus sp. TS-2]
MTGNVDMYLLMKELERESDEQFEQESTSIGEDLSGPSSH